MGYKRKSKLNNLFRNAGILLFAGVILSLFTVCKNPLQEIIARDIRGPVITISRGSTVIDAEGGTDPLGNIYYGSGGDIVYTITNTGAGDLELTGNPLVSLSGTGASLISVTQPNGSTIPAGGSKTFTLNIVPVFFDNLSANVTIETNDADNGRAVFTIPYRTLLPSPEVGTTAIAGGQQHTVALKTDGTVWAWGDNTYGQLGDSTTTERDTPVQVKDLTDGTGYLTGVTAIAAGFGQTITLKTDGTVWAWGWNGYGQLGDSTTADKHTPVQVKDHDGTGYLTGVTAIAAGSSHTVALKTDGTVWAWGDNTYGQLGDNTTTEKHTPVQVTGPDGTGYLTGITVIIAGSDHTVAIKTDGTVWAWGGNFHGQLGDGTTNNSSTPVQVTGLSGVTAITAGDGHTVALKTDGTVWAWGLNNSGQLGDGTSGSGTDRSTPVQVTGLTGVTAIAAGDANHTVALKTDGTVWAWGLNSTGQLGDGTTNNSSTAVQVTGLSGVTAIAVGLYHTVALKTDGIVWVWGLNSTGQLGDGTTNNSSTAVQVLGRITSVTAIAAGQYHTIALKTDGTVWAWGDNIYGQLGDNTTLDRYTPVQVKDLTDGTGYLTGVTAIAAGFSHTIALKTDGTVWAWGDNTYGQLGDGTSGDGLKKLTPVQVKDSAGGSEWLTGVTAIAARGQHTVALKTSGTVWAWGHNNSGQLGDGTTTDSLIPVQVTGLTGVTAISAGLYHTIALKTGGTVWAWGLNSTGQLGDGTTNNSLAAVQVTGLTGVTAIAAGREHTVALKTGGTVWAWGLNGNGQLGDGTTNNSSTAVQVTGLTGVTAIAAGYYHTIALKNDGTVWAWGNNNNGQLGDNTTVEKPSPVAAMFPFLLN